MALRYCSGQRCVRSGVPLRTPRGGIVFCTTQWGCFLWLVAVRAQDGFMYIRPRDENDWRFVCIYDYNRYEAALCRALSPVEVMTRCPLVAKALRSIRIVREGPKDTLLQCAARLGFKGMNSHHLEKMVRLIRPGLPASERPNTERAMVDFLVKQVFLGCSSDLLEAAHLARGKQRPCDSILTTFGNLEALEHSLDEDDHEEIKRSVKRTAATSAGDRKSAASADLVQAANSSTDGVAPTARPHVSAGCRERRPFSFRDEWSLADAKGLLPQVKGATLAKDPKRFLRWSATYSRPCPPTHVTKSWGPLTGLSQHAALAFVMTQVWAWHLEATGQSCPYDWDTF